jgi:hypothetical protein
MNRAAPGEVSGADVCFCPGCGRRLWYPAGDIRCHHCLRCFHIELRPADEPPTAVARETKD